MYCNDITTRLARGSIHVVIPNFNSKFLCTRVYVSMGTLQTSKEAE